MNIKRKSYESMSWCVIVAKHRRLLTSLIFFLLLFLLKLDPFYLFFQSIICLNCLWFIKRDINFSIVHIILSLICLKTAGRWLIATFMLANCDFWPWSIIIIYDTANNSCNSIIKFHATMNIFNKCVRDACSAEHNMTFEMFLKICKSSFWAKKLIYILISDTFSQW